MEKTFRKSERGQAIILIALAIVGLIAFVGLMTDGGVLFIEYARLKRAIDAAAINAALQYREGYTPEDLTKAAQEFLRLNQSDVFAIDIDTCNTDATLCTEPRRKLVRVTASRHVRFGFLAVIGIRQTDITATSVGEAASVDMVLVIDTSASMAFETSGDPDKSDPGDDPSVCNVSDTCEPLKTVKNVALDFIDTMYFPYDRVAVITMTSQVPDGVRNPEVVLPLDADEIDVRTAIQNLRVFQPPRCVSLVDPPNPAFGPCLNYDTHGTPSPADDTYISLDCPLYRVTGDPSSCPSSNVGGALTLAGNEFGREPVREDSLWVVVALVGGPANASDASDGHPYGFCPSSTWVSPFCRDASASTRHPPGDLNYDADDFARDRADFVANPLTGQGATVFTIGLGNLIRNAPSGDPDAGEKLLQYIALTAGDESGVPVSHGAYFYAPSADDLGEIFRQIAESIATRISQ